MRKTSIAIVLIGATVLIVSADVGRVGTLRDRSVDADFQQHSPTAPSGSPPLTVEVRLGSSNRIFSNLWIRCEALLSERGGGDGQPRRRSVQPLGGVVHCRCGGRMYARGRGPTGKYICRTCRAKITLDTLETLFRSGLALISIDAAELVAAVADNPRAAELTRRLGGEGVEVAEVWPLLDRFRQRQLVDLLVDRIVVDHDEVSVVFAESGGNEAESAPRQPNSLPSSHSSEARTNGTTSRPPAGRTRPPAPTKLRQGILEPKAYRIQHVADLLNLPRSTVYDLVRTGTLASIRTGKNGRVVLVPASAVAEFLEEKKRRRRVRC